MRKFYFAWLMGAALLSGCVKVSEGTLQEPAPKRPTPVHVVGKISGNNYTSPQGGFTVTFPVTPEFGGRIVHDDALSVTFHDNRGIRVTFYSRQFNAQSPMMAVLRKDGRRKALEILAKDIYGENVETHYLPDWRGGMISFTYAKPVETTTAVAMFIAENRVFVAETDLPPGVQFLSKQDDAPALNARLEKSAVELARSMDVR
jgi:hypothetical protein